jgi:osmoprotectant transport system substrate-binding protein
MRGAGKVQSGFRRRRLPSFVFVLALALTTTACALLGDDDRSKRLTVGAVTFAENQIVAEMYSLALEDAGYTVDRRFNFQSRESLQPELLSGNVDLAPEYLASLLTSLEPGSEPESDPESNLERLEPLVEDKGLELLDASEANNTNAIVVDSETAGRLKLDEVSDLRPHAAELVFGGPPECSDRPFCLKGLRAVYGLEFDVFRKLDAGGPLTIAALGSGEIDVALLFTTSGVIAEREWVVLEDDKQLQAADNITPLIRSEVLTPELAERLDAISAGLTTEAMTELNARVEVGSEDFRDVARDFIEQQNLLR